MKRKADPGPLHDVLIRFPESGDRIRALFDEDEEFRELCEDYAECAAVLERLRRGQGVEAARIEEYCELRLNIEQEVLGRISEPATQGSSASAED